tara:strand:+ start:403 stop:663 length:261 start_codon:yes stop_codon:yes gene_type:complete
MIFFKRSGKIRNISPSRIAKILTTKRMSFHKTLVTSGKEINHKVIGRNRMIEPIPRNLITLSSFATHSMKETQIFLNKTKTADRKK